MKAIGSVLALISVLIVCLVFFFVWSGTERVGYERIPMDGDPIVAQVDKELHSSMDSDPAAEATTIKTTRKAKDSQSGADSSRGNSFVVWINVSGFRGDYLDQTETPFLDSLAKQGSYTAELKPPFPSLIYPSLMSQATGRTVREHGIVSDKMRDPATGQVISNPTALALLKAEPIWTTAKRQGVGVLVHHWPFSQQQPAENAADIFIPEVDVKSGAEDRLKALLDAWTAYKKEPKIRLAMLSLNDLEAAARAHGTRAKETYDAVEKLDKTLAAFRDRLREKWPTLRGSEGDKLHIFITTDRGMVDVKKAINFGALMGELAQQVDFAACDNMAQLWFKKGAAGSDPKQVEETLDGELRSRIYWRTYTREEIPETWKLDKSPLIGDRILMLKSGYTFADTTGAEPVFDPNETGGPICTSGYMVSDQPRMAGQAFFSTLDGQNANYNLGPVDGTQLYPTICDILGITPASGVRATSMRIP